MAKGKKTGGRVAGTPNKKTLILQRVYQRCLEKEFHPADTLIEACRDTSLPALIRIETCFKLLAFLEGQQPQSKPLTPGTTPESVEAAKAVMQELEAASQPLEPVNPTPNA